MDGVYYLCMLIGVAWLCVWAMTEDGETRPDVWWPFDRIDEPGRKTVGVKTAAGDAARRAGPGCTLPTGNASDHDRTRPPQPVPPPWRRRG